MDYNSILKKNLINVVRDILIDIRDNGINNGDHLYITFSTAENNNLPLWLEKKYPHEMTIIIQYEYYNLKINDDSFNITLSFNNVMNDLQISYKSIISIADPNSNFGLILKNKNKENSPHKPDNNEKVSKKNNVINFKNFKKS